MGSTMAELQDIIKQFGGEYLDHHNLPLHQFKALKAIEHCRTAELGGHVDECDECGYTNISYNSCRNRHCPKCQKLTSERWIEARKDNLLPVQYFHIVFTLPDFINPLARFNQKEIYAILFKAASETLLELARDKKYLGAEIGFTAVLHTWGQNLVDHPHLHCIVPGGGLSPGGYWLNAKKDFFIPVKVLSRKFRGKFLAYLRESYAEGDLTFGGNIAYLRTHHNFVALLNKLYSLEWVVFSKESFKGPEFVIEYLGRYTHRVAISNSRIKSVADGKVAFEWKDRSDGNKTKIMTLNAFEFIRRFLLHILPYRFMKIRHYGLLSNRNQSKVRRCQSLLKIKQFFHIPVKLTTRELLLRITGVDIEKCPCCGNGKLTQKKKFDYNAFHQIR
jgi:hypothetical protein